MASGMHFLTDGDYSLGHGGAIGAVVDGAAAFGAGFAIGELYHRKGNKWYGKHAPKLATAIGKTLAIAASYFTGGDPNLVSGVFNAVGDAGAATMGLEYGLRHARGASGKKAILWPKDKALPPGAEETALGATPRGKGMDWNAIEEMARSR